MLKNLPELKYNGKPALPPQEEDLERLYNYITALKSTTVLEFGCGYSTLVIAEALAENKKWFDSLPEKPKVRNPELWQCVSLETDRKWIDEVYDHLPTKEHNFLVWSECICDTYNGQNCHFYDRVPRVIPDFIYLDGPDPKQVRKWIYDMPMAEDILQIEPLLMPGTKILIDGRTNNARFLRNNLKRVWSYQEIPEQDITYLSLEEPSLGPVIANSRDILEWIEKQK